MHQCRSEAIPQSVSAETVYIIADDAEAGRSTLGLLLASVGYKVEIHASTAALLNGLATTTRGCVILDVQTSKTGLHLSELLTWQSQHLHLIVVAERGDIGYAVRAMKAGAISVVEKPYSKECMVATVSTALASRPLDLTKARKASDARSRLRRLSRREFEVLRELVAGQPNKLVGHALNISPRTVEVHRANMMKKLGAHSLAEAVRTFVASELDDSPEHDILSNPPMIWPMILQ